MPRALLGRLGLLDDVQNLLVAQRPAHAVADQHEKRILRRPELDARDVRLRRHADALALHVAERAAVGEPLDALLAERVCDEGLGEAAQAAGLGGGRRVVVDGQGVGLACGCLGEEDARVADVGDDEGAVRGRVPEGGGGRGRDEGDRGRGAAFEAVRAADAVARGGEVGAAEDFVLVEGEVGRVRVVWVGLAGLGRDEVEVGAEEGVGEDGFDRDGFLLRGVDAGVVDGALRDDAEVRGAEAAEVAADGALVVLEELRFELHGFGVARLDGGEVCLGLSHGVFSVCLGVFLATGRALLQAALQLELGGRVLNVAVELVAEELAALGPSVAVEDAKVEYLWVAERAVGAGALARLLHLASHQAHGGPAGKGRYRQCPCLVGVLVVASLAARIGDAIVVLCTPQRYSNYRQVAAGYVWRGCGGGRAGRWGVGCRFGAGEFVMAAVRGSRVGVEGGRREVRDKVRVERSSGRASGEDTGSKETTPGEGPKGAEARHGESRDASVVTAMEEGRDVAGHQFIEDGGGGRGVVGAVRVVVVGEEQHRRGLLGVDGDGTRWKGPVDEYARRYRESGLLDDANW